MEEITIAGGDITTVDNDNYELLSKYSWYKNVDGYAVCTILINGKKVCLRMHRVVMGITDPKIKVDHRNGNKLCNEKWNLRIATVTQNNANTKPRTNCASKYKGVTKTPYGKWMARMRINGVKISLGNFDLEIDAAIAYDNKAIEIYGEFAETYLNIRRDINGTK